MKTSGALLFGLPTLLILAGCEPPTAVTAVDVPPALAVTPTIITLFSGNGPESAGGICSPDPITEFTLDAGATFQPACIVVPHPLYHIISGTKYINRFPDRAGLRSTTTRYRTTFVLPAGFSIPTLTVDVHADNCATIFLNGTLIGQQTPCLALPNFQDPPESFSTSIAALFQVGTNFLRFDITNSKSGAAGFDYKAVISAIMNSPPTVAAGPDRRRSTL